MNKKEILKLTGCSLEELTENFFNNTDMAKINSDHHKNNDGCLEINYCWYYDNDIWTVYHPGYCRGEIEGRGRTLRIAIDNFLKEWVDGLEEQNVY